MKEITIKISTTEQDFKSLTFFNTYKKKRGFLLFQILAAICSGGAILGRLSGAAEVANWYYYVCIAFLGLIIFQYFVFEASVKKFLRSDHLVVGSERTITISDAGLQEEGGRENSSGSYQWEIFYCAYETKKYFYLYLNTMQAIILPKRYFLPEEMDFLRELIQVKMVKRYYKR
ncbi:MAG: YcxB-like protein [Bacillota bacterium]|jgi:hypothetical protein|nr:YcxB-like protein [Bacillota bacterium]